MAQSTGSKAIPQEKPLDPGEQFDLETGFAGEEEEPLLDKGKSRARADSLSSVSDKGDGDGVLLENLEGARPRDDAWKEVVDDDTDNDEQGSASAGANLAEGRLADSSPSKEAQGGLNRYRSARIKDLERKKKREEEERRKAQEVEALVVKERADAKKRKKKEQGGAAAKSQGGQLAAATFGPSSLSKRPTATTPGTVTPNAKRARKAIQTPEQTEIREVPSPSEADAALLTAESSKRPAKRARNRKVSFSNSVALADATTDAPPAKRKAFAPKVITPGAQGSPAEAFSPTAGLQGLRDEHDEQGRFIMPPERLLQIIQSAAAELAALQTAEAMKVLTESGVDHEVGRRSSRGNRIGGCGPENRTPQWVLWCSGDLVPTEPIAEGILGNTNTWAVDPEAEPQSA
ncbi:hypothetical protein DFH08DRAFT_890070 [Mycena albidolilacea]|uniref:Uncharacterized protein n=1 Tax=Mycena albidolilacea TaxID=1033008 RepID=A0AAD6ZEU3_9AGAR|nr:hypothetical protein DFH08DRAFT_890070 [Mycena albidolilacea]